MLFVNLLNKCCDILVRLYNAEAKRLHKQAATEASLAHKLTLSSQKHIDTAANAAARAQQLSKLLNTEGES